MQMNPYVSHGDPICSHNACPLHETCRWAAMFYLRPAMNRLNVCVPGLRKQRDELSEKLWPSSPRARGRSRDMDHKYMVFVAGNRAPVVEHDTEGQARDEAMRLAMGGAGQTVYVLQVVDVLEPLTGHRWRGNKEV